MSRENYGMMNQEIQDAEVTIDLMELFSALWAKKTIIILSAIFMALVAFVGTKMFVTPKYTSVTKIFVMAKNDNTSASETYTDLQTGSMLAKDYMELVKSRPVLEKTISKLKLDVEPEELAEMITTETPADTRIMSISVTDDDPKEAKQIADILRKAVSAQITEIMSADSVNTVEEGNLPTSPSSPNVKKNMMLGALLGLVISMGLIVLISILDDTVKTPDDVEKYLGLNVLTSIPI
ncbi:YveK family protein [Dorea amylophila]|uniref:YveK family protein n=1 Tax=Dorea amylophila TaxID=2981789 RepID=UPI003266408D